VKAKPKIKFNSVSTVSLCSARPNRRRSFTNGSASKERELLEIDDIPPLVFDDDDVRWDVVFDDEVGTEDVVGTREEDAEVDSEEEEEAVLADVPEVERDEVEEVVESSELVVVEVVVVRSEVVVVDSDVVSTDVVVVLSVVVGEGDVVDVVVVVDGAGASVVGVVVAAFPSGVVEVVVAVSVTDWDVSVADSDAWTSVVEVIVTVTLVSCRFASCAMEVARGASSRWTASSAECSDGQTPCWYLCGKYLWRRSCSASADALLSSEEKAELSFSFSPCWASPSTS